jgi:outer membrane receptor for ferrienterochelin and colicin
VAGLQIQSRGFSRIPFIRNQRAAVYVDEMWRDAEFLNMLPVTDIAMIKVIKGPFVGGFGASGGVIAIYTIGTDDEEEESFSARTVVNR